MSRRARRRRTTLAALVICLLAAPACASTTDAEAPDSAPAPASDGHGIAAGSAAEVAAPASALVVADTTGAVTLLDLDSESREVISTGDADIEEVDSDGRLLYLTRAEGDRTSVDVVDTGRWTVPHGDHTHSFLGEAGLVGTLEGTGEATVSAGAQSAAVRFDDDVVVVTHDDLDVEEAARISIHATGPVVSIAEHLLAATTDAGIEVVDAAGAIVPALAAACAAASDADLTRVGVVFACADGAVLFTREVGGGVAVERLAYPAGAPGAGDLSGRADRPDLAGVAGEVGAWLLDVRERRWTLLPSELPLIRAVAVGDDDGRTVAIDVEGRVRILSSDGVVLARTEPLLAASVADPALRDRVGLALDARHVYVSDPAAGTVYEVDHADGVVTRTFADVDPWFIDLVG